MPRKARIDIKGYYYHIIARGQRKNPLFFSNKDFNYFLKLLDKYLDKYDITLYAYCLMRNHYHLLVRRNNNSLEEFFKNLHTQYAIYFNKKYSLVGHVYQGRYKSLIILHEKYIYSLINYIHKNPVKAKLIDKKENYLYSSCNYYVNNKKTLIKNIKKYNVFNTDIIININEYINTKECYIGTIEKYLSTIKRKRGRENGVSIEKRNRIKSIKNDYLKICKCNNIKMLSNNQKFFKGTQKYELELISYELFRKGYSKTEIAKFMNVHRSTILRRIKKYEKRKKIK